jgi:hypothetical protein
MVRVLRLAVIIAAIAMASTASAQFLLLGVGSGGSPSGSPGVACNAGQLDFQDGCGTTQFMVLLK